MFILKKKKINLILKSLSMDKFDILKIWKEERKKWK